MPESYYVQDDGYSLTGHVSRAPGLYPEAWFKYRPAVPERVFGFNSVFGAERLAYAYRTVAQCVDGIRRTQVGPADKLLPETLKTMHHGLFNSLLNHVLGSEGPYIAEDTEKNSVAASASS